MSAAVAKKMLAVSKEIGHIDKNGENKHFKFNFQAWDDVLPAVRDACAIHGLWIIPSADLIDRTGDLSMLRLVITFIDVDSGESYPVTWVGEAKDNQDKGFQKAATSGLKYLLLKALMIPCAEDADNDSEGPQLKPKNKAQASAVAQAPVTPAQKSPADVTPPRTGYTTADAGAFMERITGDKDKAKQCWKAASDILSQANPPMAVTEFCRIMEEQGVNSLEMLQAKLSTIVAEAIA